MAKGLNMQSVKSENRSLVLHLLNREGRLSRKEIAARLSLTPAAVTKICAELIEDGLVAEVGEAQEKGKSGRREIMLELLLKERLAFGINAERDCITFSVSNLAGELLRSEQFPFFEDVDTVIKKAKQFLMESDVDMSRFCGAGICIIGSQEERNIGVWNEENLRQKFETELGMAAVIENNVKAFAESEMLYGDLRGGQACLFLKWGPGIGSAIVADGKVFSADNSSVAEIGHCIVDRGGVKCRCGRYGCMETVAGEEAILREIGGEKTLDEILQNCDNKAMMIIEQKIDLVALVLTNAATMLDVNKVILFGKMFTYPLIAEKLEKQCMRYDNQLKENTVSLSSLEQKRNYIGCSAICAKQFFFNRTMSIKN